MTRMPSPYYDSEAIEKAVEDGQHRSLIGGMWDEIGQLQFKFLASQGLKPHHKLLDIGCGSLRGGVHFVKYLQPENYFGIDLNISLLDAGYDNEIVKAGLQARLPRSNLIEEKAFKLDRFSHKFDFAIALSVFTHLPLSIIGVCLQELPSHMIKGSCFYASYFAVSDDKSFDTEILQPPGLITTYPNSDPYHQRFSDYQEICLGLPWKVTHLGHFDHPRGQQMLEFKRV